MRGIIRFSLNNKFALWILTVLVVAAGLYSGLHMKAETLPNIEIPIVNVTATYPGAAPEDVLDKLTKPIEQRVRNLDGVSVVTSNSLENVSSIRIEYSYSKDMNKAETEVKSALSSLNLPAGVQAPTVSRLNFNAFPVIGLSIADSKRSPDELTALMQNEIVPAFQKVNGVATVTTSGQQVQEADIRLNPDKLKAHGLSADTVKSLIQGSAVMVPLGIYEMDNTEKVLVVDGNVHTLDDLKKLALPLVPQAQAGRGTAAGGAQAGAASQGAGAGAAASAAQGAGTQAGAAAPQDEAAPQAQATAGAAAAQLPTVKLGDVADIAIVSNADSISRTNGQPSIGVSVVKATDANTVDVVNGIKAEITALNQKYPDLQIIQTLDQGKPIQDSISTMLSKALFGAIFAVVIILLFLRNLRTTLISIVSIPLSLLIAVLLLKQMNITLNLMTLGAMTVAIGRVVDDSIVVIENIYRRMSLTGEVYRGKKLIIEASREMFTPIFSSTIVTIAVFLPMALVTGPIGQLFMSFALTIVFALSASLIVAVTVVPMLAHLLMKRGLSSKHHRDENEPGRLASAYRNVLSWALGHKWITVAAALLLLAGSLFLLKPIGFSFLPGDEQKSAIFTYNPSPSERKEDVEALAVKAEEALMNRGGVQVVQYTVGGGNPFRAGSSKQALFTIEYKDTFKGITADKKQAVEQLKALGGKGEWKEQNGGGGATGGSNLSVYVYGEDLKTIEPAANQILDAVKSSPDFTNADTSLSLSYDQYKLTADSQKLSQLGLSAGQIALALMPQRDRPVLTTIEKDGRSINVYLNVDKTAPATKTDLENTTVHSPLGTDVALKDVVTIEEGKSPNTIQRRNNQVYAEVTAQITNKKVSDATSALQSKIKQMNLPSGVDVQFGGVTQQINDSFSQLGLAMLAAIAIVYFILVVTFGGALAPLAILFSLPFTVIGALAALYLAGETLSVSAMIGALMLIGIVVTNAIVLIDRVIKKEYEGLKTRDAILEAAATRLRPILMTAIATIGALLPLAFGFESGGLISKGLGITVIGGLASSTLLTLLIVPVVYEALRRLSPRSRRSLREEE